jgi:PTH1 family peptidyl-tRNA hydrolase
MNHPHLNAIRAIIGLGNPGKEYASTYHNVGQRFVLAYERSSGAKNTWKQEGPFSYARCGKYILVIPKIFMNESGYAARAVQSRFKIRPEEMLVAHDESDLPLGEYRIAFGRGAAGHRGVASAIEALRTKDFWRLRIGVRTRPGKAGVFVLRPISKTANITLQSATRSAIEILKENETP